MPKVGHHNYPKHRKAPKKHKVTGYLRRRPNLSSSSGQIRVVAYSRGKRRKR